MSEFNPDPPPSIIYDKDELLETMRRLYADTTRSDGLDPSRGNWGYCTDWFNTLMNSCCMHYGENAAITRPFIASHYNMATYRTRGYSYGMLHADIELALGSFGTFTYR